MDDLLSNLTDFTVTEIGTSTHVPHPRYTKSKKMMLQISQEERRRKLLQLQKKRRESVLDGNRVGLDETSDDDSGSQGKKRGRRKSSEYPDDYAKELRDLVDGNLSRWETNLKNVLMLSEWLVDVPPALEEDWLFTLCPVGKRTLVMANRNKTVAFTKMGYEVSSFPSLLPGSGHHHDYMTILDCIVSLELKTYYVLDVICWQGQSMIDCDKACRAYYLRSRLDEEPGLREASQSNHYKFIGLDYVACRKDNMAAAMNSPMPFEARLDGVLFYHKEGAYTSGQTPLATWLKPHMMTDVLGVPVAESLLKPPENANSSMEVDSSQKKDGRWRKGGRRSPNKLKANSMEHSTVSEESTCDNAGMEVDSKQHRKKNRGRRGGKKSLEGTGSTDGMDLGHENGNCQEKIED